MRFRDRVALNVSPLLLRLVLGATFIWAGLGKVTTQIEVSGQDAAILASYGVVTPPAPPAPPAQGAPQTPLPTPTEQPPQEPTSAPPDKPAPDQGTGDGSSGGLAMGPSPYRIVLIQGGSPRQFTAADFPTPVRVKAVHAITLIVHKAGDPNRYNEKTGKQLQPIWPASMSGGSWPIVLAWLATITEIIGGVVILLGLFTRLAALGLTGTMIAAIWLTQIGPAIQAGSARLGFLPAYDAFDISNWMPFFWQFALLAMAGSVLLSGPGALSLDRFVFAPSRPPTDEDTDDDDD